MISAVTLIVFALLVRLMFRTAFYQNAYEDDLKGLTANAVSKVELLFSDSDFLEAFIKKDRGVCEAPLRFLGEYADVAYADVWIVAGGTVMASFDPAHNTLEFDEIPSRYQPMLEVLFSGSSVGNVQYEKVWNKNMFGVGLPVYGPGGQVLAAVITQISNDHVQTTTRSADAAVLFSTGAALIIAMIIQFFLSESLILPLVKMKASAEILRSGDYSARTTVSRRDEIGDLASAMDMLAARLEKLASERTQSELARYQFFADISHELKTPITVLRAQIEMLMDGIITEPAEFSVCLTDALSETRQMQRLVEDLLTLAKLESPEFPMTMEPVCLSDILEDVLRSHQALSAERGVSLKLDQSASEREQSIVLGDYARIRQLINILVDNAEKYTNLGDTVEVTLTTAPSPIITVSDNGPGMTPKELQHAFDRFYTHYRTSGGTGLGLPIARGIAQRLHAELTMESTPGMGTRAVIRF